MAVLEDRDAVADAYRLVEVVGDEDDGLVQGFLQFQQLVLHVRADQRVEGAEGLVHEDDLSVGGQRAGQADTLAHATGKLVRIGLLVALQAHRGDPVQGPLVALRPAFAANLQAVGDIVEHALVRQQAETLEHHADLAPAELPEGFHVVAQDVLAIHQDLAAGGVDQAVEVAHQGRLAGTRQAHDHEDLASADGQRQVVDADHAAGLRQHFGLAASLADQRQRGIGARAEDLEHVLHFDLVHLRTAHLLVSCREQQ